MAVLLQRGRHVVDAHGRRLDVFGVQPGVEEIRVDEKNFHEKKGERVHMRPAVHRR